MSNFDIVFSYIMKKLAPALDGCRGLWVCRIIFLLFCLYTIFLKITKWNKEWQLYWAWQGSFHLKDHSYNEWFLFKWIFIYFSDSNLYEMTACKLCCWLQSLHLHYLLCLFKLWTCHFHLDPPPHLSVFSFIAIFFFFFCRHSQIVFGVH